LKGGQAQQPRKTGEGRRQKAAHQRPVLPPPDKPENADGNGEKQKHGRKRVPVLEHHFQRKGGGFHQMVPEKEQNGERSRGMPNGPKDREANQRPNRGRRRPGEPTGGRNGEIMHQGAMAQIGMADPIGMKAQNSRPDRQPLREGEGTVLIAFQNGKNVAVSKQMKRDKGQRRKENKQKRQHLRTTISDAAIRHILKKDHFQGEKRQRERDPVFLGADRVNETRPAEDEKQTPMERDVGQAGLESKKDAKDVKKTAREAIR
jgi:hypothetical protein